MARIDYLYLKSLLDKKDQHLIATCIRLARENPVWDWSRVPHAKPAIVAAHNQLWAFLQTQPAFMEAIRKDSFIERWKRRGAPLPVTSDHVKVTNQFHLYENGASEPSMSLRVSTWNMMNKAHSKANCHQKDPQTGLGLYANTPEEDLDEDVSSYTERKREQFRQILEQIRSVPTTDAFFLQEVDFLTNPLYANLKEEFESVLKQNGYTILLTPKAPSAKAQAIVFNTNIWELDQKNPPVTSVPGTSVGGSDPRNTLFEVNLVHKISRKPACLISAHLDFTGNYSSTMLEKSRLKAKSGAVVIWGGDTNHTPGHQIQGLTGDFHHATNYDVAATGYTAQHMHSSQAKTYDGFGFCPPKNAKIRSVEEPGERFYINSHNQVEIRQFTPEHPFHETLTGQPWRRRQSIVLDALGFRTAFIQLIYSVRSQENASALEAIIKQIKEAETLGTISVLATSLQRLLPSAKFQLMQDLLNKANELLGDEEALDKAIQNPQNTLKEFDLGSANTENQSKTTEPLKNKRELLLSLRKEIIAYNWQVGFGAEEIEGRKIPRNAAAIYKICGENITTLDDKDVESKFNQVATIVRNTQKSHPLITFLRKIDFLRLFTRSEDTQNRYRLFNTRIEEAKGSDIENKPPHP